MRRVVLATLAAALALGTGCAAMRASRAHDEALRAALDANHLSKPLPEVWQEVRRLLHERRYGLAGKDLEALGIEGGASGILINLFSPARETQSVPRGGLTLETGWGPEGIRKRYHVEGSAGPDGTQVIFVAVTEDQTEHGHDKERARDLELELLLVRQLDPEAAERIEQAVGPKP
jgi:hypothetical protein